MAKAQPYVCITPLGGLGEIGLNCQIWETQEGVVLVDCGLMFPDDYHLGVDVVIPRFESLFTRKEKMLGVVLTHGHEDHIGALPWLVPHFKGLKIYGSPFTLALVEHKLTEHNLIDRAELITVQPRSHIQLGSLDFCFLPVCHSIPQGYALAVTSPIGRILHTGDFKLDPSLDQGVSLVDEIREFATPAGVKLLLSDSTNVEMPGHSRQESEVRETLGEIFAQSEGRILITLFSSHIVRIGTVMELAKENGRSVFAAGRSLSSNIEKAMNLGLLPSTENVYIPGATMPGLAPEKTVIVATGSQGEPLSALTRIANGEHRQVSLCRGDTVIMSSRVIPGNAKAVSRLINQMYRLGATVFHDSRRTIHATGHACQGELEEIIRAASPEYFIPVHGEYRHLSLHAQLARSCGVDKERVLILEDGRSMKFYKGKCRQGTSVSVESVLVDGKGVGDVGQALLRERHILGDEGLVVVILVVAEGTWEILHGPEIISRGFVFSEQYNHVLEDAKCLVLEQVENAVHMDSGKLEDRIRSTLRRFFRGVLERDPIVMPVVTVI